MRVPILFMSWVKVRYLSEWYENCVKTTETLGEIGCNYRDAVPRIDLGKSFGEL